MHESAHTSSLLSKLMPDFFKPLRTPMCSPAAGPPPPRKIPRFFFILIPPQFGITEKAFPPKLRRLKAVNRTSRLGHASHPTVAWYNANRSGQCPADLPRTQIPSSPCRFAADLPV